MTWLVGFAVISQWPYWLLFEREQGNIMLTLACGLSLICGLRMPGWPGTLIAVVSIAIPLVIPVSYGLPGVILPAAFLVALHCRAGRKSRGRSLRQVQPLRRATSCMRPWQPLRR